MVVSLNSRLDSNEEEEGVGSHAQRFGVADKSEGAVEVARGAKFFDFPLVHLLDPGGVLSTEPQRANGQVRVERGTSERTVEERANAQFRLQSKRVQSRN